MKKLKITLIAVALVTLITGNVVNASFPVKSQPKQEQTTGTSNSNSDLSSVEKQSVAVEKAKSIQPEKTQMDEELLITLLLWFFLGGLAAHRWYKKKPAGWNILFILTLGGCGIWAIIDLVNILTGKF